MARRTYDRIPEQEIMDSCAQAEAYDSGIKNSSVLGAYLLLGDILNLCAPRSGRVIDLGCGQAYLDIDLAMRVPGLMFDCLELSGPMLELAAKNVEEADKNVKGSGDLRKRINLVQQDMFDIDNLAQDYDMATGIFMLHHIKDKEKAIEFLKALKKKLKPGAGIAFIDFIRPRSEEEKKLWGRLLTVGFDAQFKADFFNSLDASWSFDEYRDIFEKAGFTDLIFMKSPFVESNIFIIRPPKRDRAALASARHSPLWEKCGGTSKLRYYLSRFAFHYSGIRLSIK